MSTRKILWVNSGESLAHLLRHFPHATVNEVNAEAGRDCWRLDLDASCPAELPPAVAMPHTELVQNAAMRQAMLATAARVIKASLPHGSVADLMNGLLVQNERAADDLDAQVAEELLDLLCKIAPDAAELARGKEPRS